VDLDTLCPGHETEYIVAEYRIAAFCHAVIYALDVLCINHKDIVVVSAFFLDAGSRLSFCFDRCRPGLDIPDLVDHVLDVGHIKLAFSDRSIECIDGLVRELLHHCGHGLVVELHLPVLQPSAKQLLAVGGLLELGLAQLLPDLVAGLVADHDIQPVLRRFLILAGHNLHDISGLQLLVDPYSLSVDLSTGTSDTEIGMDVECKIKDCRSGRKFPELSGRCEHEDLLRRHFHELVLIVGCHRVPFRAKRVLKCLSDGSQPFVQRRLVAYALV